MPASRIMHASDFSPASAPAFAQAVEMAKTSGAELVLVHVVAPVPPAVGDGYIPPRTFERITRSNQEYAERRLAALGAKAQKAGVRTSTLVLEGIPWEAITRAARAQHAGMLVLGTHGRTGLAKVFLGSIAERVIATAPCPVLTVRGR